MGQIVSLGQLPLPIGGMTEEKILNAPRNLKRTISSPQLDQEIDIPPLRKGILYKLEEDALNLKDGALWKCVRRFLNPSGGYIYEFVLRKKYDDTSVLLKMAKIREGLQNPNLSEVERTWQSYDLVMASIDEGRKKNAVREKIREIFPSIEFRKIEDLEPLFVHPMTSLGYSLTFDNERVKITLPDEEALSNNWKEYRLSSATPLPDLDILCLEGILPPMQYFEATFRHHGVLSEFVHDHLVHLLPSLQLLVEKPNGSALIKLLGKAWRTFILAKQQFHASHPTAEQAEAFKEKSEIAETLLTIFADMVTSIPKDRLNNDYVVRQYMGTIWTAPGWVAFLEQKFTREKLERLHATTLWHEFLKLEIDFDVERNKLNPPLPLGAMDPFQFKCAGQKILVNNGDDEWEIVTITDQAKSQSPVEYLIKGRDSRCALIHWNMHWDEVKVGTSTNLENHPILIDIACQFALVHGNRRVILAKVPDEWPLYFELGFRFQFPFDSMNEAFLIEYAFAMNLLTPGEIRLLEQLKQVTRDEELRENRVHAPLKTTLDEELSLVNGKKNLFHSMDEITDATIPLLFDVMILAFDEECFSEWSDKAASGDFENGPIAVGIGQRKLETELANLRERMAKLNERHFGGKGTEYPAGWTCKIL